MSQDPACEARVLEESLIHEGYSYNFVDLTVKFKDGVVRSKPVVRHNGAVMVLPILDTDEGRRIVMVHNERIAVNGKLLELPAGGIAAGEEPAETARRELIEEAGYRADFMEPLCQFYTSPGLTDEMMHVFVAKKLTAVGQQLEPFESMTVQLLEPLHIYGMLDGGKILNGASVLSLLWARAQGVFE